MPEIPPKDKLEIIRKRWPKRHIVVHDWGTVNNDIAYLLEYINDLENEVIPNLESVIKEGSSSNG